MTISVWRYSHLALAVVSFVFIALASLTGIVLAFEPVAQQLKPYAVKALDTIPLARVIPVLKQSSPGIIDVTIEGNHYVRVTAIDEDSKKREFYVHPLTGHRLADVHKKSDFFEWVTTMHRSLFLHKTGRLFVGISSFLLFLIALSGTILVIQRQRSLKRFFSKLVKENFTRHYHVVLGRLSLIPIIILSLTGTYLFLIRFEIFPAGKTSSPILVKETSSLSSEKDNAFSAFKNIMLGDVQKLEFPFSDDPEDYFTLKLKTRELLIHQYTGEVLGEMLYGTNIQLTNLSLDLHTGRSSSIWAILLASACINILFFIYSGFAITIKRRENKFRNKYPKEECDTVILVGSENGSTFGFATAVHQQLIKTGRKAYLTELNNYTVFPKAEQLVVITATYGQGNAPSNASKFLKLLEEKPQLKKIYFSVVGFGSRAYPDFCQFAFEVQHALSSREWAIPLLNVQTVNDKSPADFIEWSAIWSQKTEIPFTITELPKTLSKRRQLFTVTGKQAVAGEGQTFLLRLKPKAGRQFTSGDLLAIYPTSDHRERCYSIAKINKEIQLSVRLHPGGLGSGYLYALEKGQTLEAQIIKNQGFHFPKRAKHVIMISNGTGIAPFLGMLDQNSDKTACHLYCGFRDQPAFGLYGDYIQKKLEHQKLSRLQVAYSREGEKQYVKDLLAKDAVFISHTLENKGVIMICGSLAMQNDVLELLETICVNRTGKSISFYQARKQVLTDCY